MTAPVLDSLVPQPRHTQAQDGSHTLPERVAVRGETNWTGLLETLLPVRLDAAADEAITLVRDNSLASEGYRLEVTEEGVTITAATDQGVRHACQTINQLLPDGWLMPTAPEDTSRQLPLVTIQDEPRFSWRGMHIDVSRHFRPINWLFRYVDALALHKFNVLHLHLTDDQGWRFEVKALPRLTEVGACREGTRYPSWAEHDGIPRGGFYTHDQLRALVAHAADRGITIVPEVDVPGHVRALLAAYPEYGWGEGQGVPTNFDVFPEVLWLSDETVAMVERVYTELLEVFPSEYIHIGGDECPKRQWRDNPAADELAASRGLESFQQLQRWFTMHLRDWLEARGRRVMGWDEVIDDGPVPGALIHAWRGTKAVARSLEAGNQVVAAPSPTLYFDSYQSDSDDEPYGREPVRTWADVVTYDPTEGLPAEQLAQLVGVQGQVWSEFMPTDAHTEYMAFPRACALAQMAWHSSSDADEFEPRLRAHLPRVEALGIRPRPLDGPLPWQRGGSGARKREPW